jgi:hypothetical protein
MLDGSDQDLNTTSTIKIFCENTLIVVLKVAPTSYAVECILIRQVSDIWRTHRTRLLWYVLLTKSGSIVGTSRKLFQLLRFARRFLIYDVSGSPRCGTVPEIFTSQKLVPNVHSKLVLCLSILQLRMTLYGKKCSSKM